MSDPEHPDVVIDAPNGPILVATWNGAAYECPVCHALTGTAEGADQHADPAHREGTCAVTCAVTCGAAA